MKKIMTFFLFCLTFSALASSVKVDVGLSPVGGFEIKGEKVLGKLKAGDKSYQAKAL